MIYSLFYRKQTTSADSAISMAGAAAGKPPLTAKSPVKPPPRPKSRVRDTIKLFDAKYNKTPYRGSASAMPAIKPSAAVAATSGERGGTRGSAGGPRTTPSGGSNTGARLRARATVASPKTGGGEGLAGDGGM